MFFKKLSILFSLFFFLLGLASCYQIHSDDDLRTVPVTNNPHIVPQSGSRIPGAGI